VEETVRIATAVANALGYAHRQGVIYITDACDRLLESGLQERFSGAIKFFHCHSGAGCTPQGHADKVESPKRKNADVDRAYKENLISRQQRRDFQKPIQNNKSIARNGADYLRRKGLVNCVYYGYLGPLASEYADVDGEMHKRVELESLENRTHGLDGLGYTRASRARVQL
jgi:hypothetical protein